MKRPGIDVEIHIDSTGAGEPILEVEEYIGPNKDNPPTGFSHIGMFVLFVTGIFNILQKTADLIKMPIHINTENNMKLQDYIDKINFLGS